GNAEQESQEQRHHRKMASHTVLSISHNPPPLLRTPPNEVLLGFYTAHNIYLKHWPRSSRPHRLSTGHPPWHGSPYDASHRCSTRRRCPLLLSTGRLHDRNTLSG